MSLFNPKIPLSSIETNSRNSNCSRKAYRCTSCTIQSTNPKRTIQDSWMSITRNLGGRRDVAAGHLIRSDCSHSDDVTWQNVRSHSFHSVLAPKTVKMTGFGSIFHAYNINLQTVVVTLFAKQEAWHVCHVHDVSEAWDVRHAGQ